MEHHRPLGWTHNSFGASVAAPRADGPHVMRVLAASPSGGAGVAGHEQSQRMGTRVPAAAAIVGEAAGSNDATSTPLAPSPAPVKPWMRMVSGLVAGATGISVVYPLDTAKLRLQTRSGEYKGTMDVIGTMMRREGALSVYRGLSSPVVGYGAINSLLLSSYGLVTAAMCAARPEGEKGRPLTMAESVAAGALSGSISVVLRSPVERIKSVMQVRRNPDGTKVYRNTWQCLVQTMRKEGRLSPFVAGRATLLREFLQGMAYFPAFHLTKQAFVPEGGTEADLKFHHLLLAGAVSGMTQWLPPMYCVDVIKSRVEVAPVGTVSTGIIAATRAAVKQDGPRVLLRGIWPALLRAAPLHAVILTTNDLVMAWLSRTLHHDGGLQTWSTASDPA